MGLAVLHLVAGHHRLEGALGQRDQDGIGQGAPGHGDQRVGHARLTKGLEQLEGTGPPGDVLLDPGDDPEQQLVDDAQRVPGDR